MAHISHRLGPFTGQVGPVVFTNGEAETEDPQMLDYFEADPDTYDVLTDTAPDPDQGPADDDPQE